MMSHLYFKEESDFYHSPPQKETKHIHASAADLLHTVLEQEISIGADAEI